MKLEPINLILAGSGILVLGILLWLEPIAQDPRYHLFADRRTWCGIPNVGDVLSNIGFLLTGAGGLLCLPKAQFHCTAERHAFRWFFAGVLATGIGSLWYHWAPSNTRLLWDRLPMTIAFMALFSAVLQERLSPILGRRALFPLLCLGVISVLWWHWTETQGAGDLRLYGLVQFYPMLAIACMLLLCAASYQPSYGYWPILLWYMIAKLAEIYDTPIFQATGSTLSGHSVKHLLAAVAVAWAIRMLLQRRPVTTLLQPSNQ